MPGSGSEASSMPSMMSCRDDGAVAQLLALLPRGLFWKQVESVWILELRNDKVQEGQIDGMS